MTESYAADALAGRLADRLDRRYGNHPRRAGCCVSMSKPVVVTIPHELGRAEARKRLDEGTAQLTSQIGAVGDLKKEWVGDTLHFSLVAIGQTVSGTIGVEDREVRLEVRLPGIFAMIANKVKGRLREQGQILLEGPKRG
jgi:hypothetical protein